MLRAGPRGSLAPVALDAFGLPISRYVCTESVHILVYIHIIYIYVYVYIIFLCVQKYTSVCMHVCLHVGRQASRQAGRVVGWLGSELYICMCVCVYAWMPVNIPNSDLVKLVVPHTVFFAG